MKRALIVAATGGFLNGFLIPDMKLLQEMGYEVHCAANGNSVSTFVPEERFASIGVTFHQIDFSSTSPVSKESLTAYKQYDRHEDLEDVVIKMGSQKLIASADEISNKWHRGFVRWYRLYRVFKDNDIKVLHLNGGPASDMTTVFIAKLAGVKHVTFHSHNAGNAVYRNKISVAMSKIFKLFMPIFVDEFWACSSLAAQFSFPKSIVKNQKYKFIPNGIALEKFSYNVSLRKEMRKKLGVEDKFVIGHAGRFNIQKNHEYLIEMFSALHSKCPDTVLLLFGDGELYKKIQDKVKKMNLEDSVRFMGTTDEMPKMYQAIDVFVMPSFCEGLPVAGVEAQASGLPVILADTITKEVGVTNCVKYLPLSDDKAEWVREILNFRGFKRYSRCEELKRAGFDEKDVARYFQNYYLKVLENLK